MVRGAVIAWFADFDEAARDWCSDNYFGEWLTWRSAAPSPIPLTEDEMAECSKRGAELAAKLHALGQA